MTDIASLGVEINTGQVRTANSDLDFLAQIARNTAATVAALERTAATTAAAIGKLSPAASEAATQIEAAATKTRTFAQAMVGLSDDLNNATSDVRDFSAVGQRGLDQLRAKFDPLFAAGMRYKESLSDIRDAHAAGALTQTQYQAAIERTKTAFTAQTAILTGNKNALNSVAASGQLARHELINLSRQAQDIVVSLGSGQSPFTVLLQQGTQVADIFGSSKTGTVGGAIKQIGSGIASVLTPMRLLALGTTALAAGGVLAYSSWKTFTLQLDDTARAAGTSTRELSKLQAAASAKGISGDDFNKGIGGFANQIYQAKNNMGGLADVFRANAIPAVKSFEDGLAKAADLIQRAGSDQQRLVLLQQMGLPATMEWVRLLSGGADGLRKAKDASAEFAADEKLVEKARQFDEAWDRAWTNFGRRAKSAFQVALDAGTTFFERQERARQDIANKRPDLAYMVGKKPEPDPNNSDFKDRFGSFSGSSTSLSDGLRQRADTISGNSSVDYQKTLRVIAIETPKLGALGQTRTAQQMREGQNESSKSKEVEYEHDSDCRRRAA
ncbi:MAG: phage tail length tape measure family protein [Rhodopseudomonas palustris]|uniref:Phage tail length tape measure family protein n=1 Tax=Rhodopseudomonas palustris TaxID=1076 RepID=A0A933RYR9_RHOPL|nr:phage tail length tape measure family protein [Rhodopseudomonas palustris]